MSLLFIALGAAFGAIVQVDNGQSDALPSSANVSLPSSSTSLPSRFAVDDERLGIDSPWYWSVGASLVTTRSADGPSEEIDFDAGWGLQLALGRRCFGATDDGMMLDLELEGLYTDQESDGNAATNPIGDLGVAAMILNGLVALQIAEETELFIGGGLGLAWLDITTQNDSLSSFADEDGPFFAWQLRAGVRFGLGASTNVEVGYRLLSIDQVEIDDGVGDMDFALETQQHSLGLTVRFGT